MNPNQIPPLNQPPGDSPAAQTDLVAHIVQLPIIRSSSGQLLTETQTHQNVYPKRYRVTYIREVPSALELEEQSHAAARDAANAIIEDLRAQVAALEAEKVDLRAELSKAHQQITEVQSKPGAIIIPVEANDFTPDSKLTKAESRTRQLARALKHVGALLDAVGVPQEDATGGMLLDARIRWLAEQAGLDTSQLPPDTRTFNKLWNTREIPPDGPGKVLVGQVGQKTA